MFRTIVPFLLLGLLAGCNGGEDFGGSGSGPVVELPGGDQPIPDVGQDAVTVELVTALEDNGVFRSAAITNLGYECTGSRAFIPATGDSAGQARCHPSATSVSFFIGADGVSGQRIYLGTVYLPNCTARSRSAQCTGKAGGIGGVGFFQFAVADMVPGIAPKRGTDDDPKVRNRAALLAALDGNPDTRIRIEIPAEAHANVGFAPAVVFNEPYGDFVNRWNGWITLVSDAAQVAEPLAFPDTFEKAEMLAQAGIDRTRTGLYELAHNPLLYNLQNYGLELPFTRIQLPFSVTADGTAFGVGAVIGENPGSTDKPQDFLALESDIFLDGQLFLRNLDNDDRWGSGTIINSANADLDFVGRVIGAVLYDGLSSIALPDFTDYTLDYSFATDKPTLNSEEVGRFTGTSFGNNFTAAPYRLERTGSASAFLHPEVMAARPQFYQLTIYRSCDLGEDATDCPRPIPEIEKGVNYGDITYTNASDEEAVFEPEFEKPRTDYYLDAQFNIEILEDGTVVMDSDGNCAPVTKDTVNRLYTDSEFGHREYPVGFVSRTYVTDTDEKSMNLALFLAGPPSTGVESERLLTSPSIPHFGTRIEGRINLELAEMPMYRLGDEGFDDGIRAIWFDEIQPELHLRSLPEDPSSEDQVLYALLTTGSVEGVGLDAATCTPLTP